MTTELGYEDWDKVVQACEREFSLIERTRKSMDVAERCQRVTYDLAVEEREKYPEPEPEPEPVNRLTE